MNFFELHGFLQGFFMRRQAWLLSGLLLAAGGFTAHAQPSTSKPVLLNVVAVDSAGKPVPDLTASDFSVFDDGSKQQIVSLRRNQSDQPKPLVILFDLMNSGESSRGAVWNAVKTSLVQSIVYRPTLSLPAGGGWESLSGTRAAGRAVCPRRG